MIKNILFLICFSLLSCTSKDKVAKEVEVVENLNFEYDFKSYSHRDSIDINELVTANYPDDEQEAKLDNPETFIYMDSDRQIRMSIFVNKKWRTWTIHDAQNEQYYAKMHRKDFDNVGNSEIIIQSKYGIVPQSTFGSSYYGSFQIWNIDSVKLYFDIENYEYSDDSGRNGDNSYTNECFSNVEVKERRVFVDSLDKNGECYLESELAGEYLLENGNVVKKK